jgi:hypothetical protein
MGYDASSTGLRVIESNAMQIVLTFRKMAFKFSTLPRWFPCNAGLEEERRWRDGAAPPRSAYEAGISAGLDGDYNPLDDGYDSEPRRWRGRSHDSIAPTNTLFVRVRCTGPHLLCVNDCVCFKAIVWSSIH